MFNKLMLTLKVKQKEKQRTREGLRGGKIITENSIEVFPREKWNLHLVSLKFTLASDILSQISGGK